VSNSFVAYRIGSGGKKTSFETFNLNYISNMVVFFVLNGGTAARHLHYTYLEMRSFTHREFVGKQSLLLHVVYKNKVIEIANNFSMCALLCNVDYTSSQQDNR
jgi:hypothetical protein